MSTDQENRENVEVSPRGLVRFIRVMSSTRVQVASFDDVLKDLGTKLAAFPPEE